MVSSCTTVMYPEKEFDMSFSSEVKEELAKHISPARHCQIAELAVGARADDDLIDGDVAALPGAVGVLRQMGPEKNI